MVRAEPGETERAGELRTRLEAGALGRPFEPPPPAPPPPTTEPWLAALLTAAEDRFVAFDLEGAQALLDEALARLDREGPGASARSELVELLLWRARAAEALEDAPRADQAVAQALAIAPDLVVDPSRHPPSLAARVDAARASLTRCPFPLSVPEGASVSVDAGAPAPPAELPCGRHWITVVAAGHRPLTRAVLADAALPIEPLALELDPGAALALPSTPGTEPPALWDEAARALSRPLVVLDVAREGERLRVQLGDQVVHAPLSASAGEVIALLRAAADALGPSSGPDVGVVVAVTAGSALAVALAITLGVVLTQPAETGFTARGTILP